MSVSTPLTLFLTQLLGSAPPPVRDWWASAQRLQLQRGQPLLQAGDRWQHLWWVERGALRLYYLDSEGAESNKNFFLDGSMLWPVTPWLRETPAMFHVEPMEDATVLWALPWPATGGPATTWPAWASLEHRTLCALLDGKMQREQEFLQLGARQRYEKLVRERPQWADRIPLRHLASYLGMTDVTLSRVRSELGLIKG
ncbi:Crp/Fnr family transcriptional regulator [Acidovorax sp. Leaf78]|uniref:Crp/Fnr family transcriptional regulator n=1 Tax=Acidovorax sp. Leaf78 TaxID=1736237 RepID=UPI0006FBF124|nr:Crp/Fnr family transcriptional regulator [Acidovorax sp. Leaf78]KQO17062.1 Crp/Fnr family transcriptional regulator [Acidovorax sp. Leaf78]